MECESVCNEHYSLRQIPNMFAEGASLVPRPSLSLSFEVTILEAGKKELVKREEGLVKLIT